MTQDELHTIIQSGEGYKIEFKRSVNSDLSKEMVAFANSSGGRILIGIDDNGTGVPRIKKGMMEAELPEPKFEFDKFFVITLKREVTSAGKTPLADLNVTGARLERIRYILENMKAGKKADVTSISKKFSVNASAIRKDFLLLKGKGWLKGSGTTSNRVYELTEMAIARMEQ